jgi:hypothetical protein
MATRAHRKTPKANTATAELLDSVPAPELHAHERASEIRLRGHARDDRDEREDERDTEPAPPPPLDEPARAPWLDLDRELTLDLLRLEDMAHDYAKRSWAKHVAAVLEDVEALADALFAVSSHSRNPRAGLSESLPRIYVWARDVLAEVSDAIEVDSDARGMARSFSRIASYSSLLVDCLVRPALAQAISVADIDGDQDELDRLCAVHERISLLKWTLLCAARSGP